MIEVLRKGWRSGFCVFLIYSIFSIHSNLSASDYSWPLEQNYGIAATFGESRSDHFHAGIDLSTNGETRLPVLAVDDGIVYRLKIQKRAYGKALYIRHANGLVSVYAHLDAFSTELGLEQAYERKVAQTGSRYVGDVFIDPPVKVTKGQIVALSGETGAGLPHLHFELRRSESEAVNPLENGFQDFLDPVPPTFQACYLYPADAASSIDGDQVTQTIKLTKQDAYYVPDHTPVIHGDFTVSVSAYDPAARPYHRSPQKLTYSVDDQTVFTIDFDSFSYTEPEYLGFVYDLGKPGAAYYEYPIFLTKPNVAVPFMKNGVTFSARKLTAGLHHLKIEAADANANTSFAHVDFIVNTPPQSRIDNLAVENGELVATVSVTDPDWQQQTPETLAAEVEYSPDGGKTFSPFPLTMLDLQAPKGSARFFSRLPLQQISSDTRLLVKVRGFDGVEHSPFSIVALKSMNPPVIEPSPKLPPGKLRYTAYGSSIKVFYDTNQFFPGSLQLSGPDASTKYEMLAKDLNSYQTVFTPPRASGSYTYSLTPAQQITIPVNYVLKANAVELKGENYEVQLEPESLIADTFVWPQSLPAYSARVLPLVGPMLQLGPRGLYTRKKAGLIFHYPATQHHPEKLSIYRWDRAEQRWKSLPSVVDPAEHVVKTGISVFDLYALLYDNQPPVITPIFPRRYRNTTTNRTPTLAAGIRDSGMDVNDEKVTFFIDGKSYPAEYDPDHNAATLKIDKALRPGYHKFWVVAYDYGDNRTQSPSITFRIR